ncbi:MAG: VWA domain-containing protein [Gammaproteobacteria bacterium]|nr:VWA domain-containing protein [Gammaproteobacteria bacterium]
MRHLPRQHRFSAWDGSQKLALDADQVMAALADDLIEYGDLRWAMRNLVSRGMQIPQGGYLQGLRDMLKELRDRKRERLRRYDLSSIFDGFRERLDEILDMERQRIDEWLQPGPVDAENFSNEVLKSVAERNLDTLDGLPEDTAGQIKALDDYEFLDPEAQKKYLELVNELRRAMTSMFFKDIENMVKNLSDGDIRRMKEMLKALNEMLVRRIAGEDPGFDAFMDEFGDMFGDKPPRSLDELLENMRAQMAAAQSLLNSMSAAQRAELQSMLQSRFGDPELDAELRKLVKELDFLDFEGGQYRFDGSERLDLEAALDLMNEMQNIDELIREVQEAERGAGLDRIDRELLRDFMGDDAVENLDNLKELLDALEEAGYVRATGDNRWELTPRGSRMIGQQALGEIYQRLKNQNLGNHAVPEEGRFGERLEQTKAYEFGDPFHPHMPRTIRNAVFRIVGGGGAPRAPAGGAGPGGGGGGGGPSMRGASPSRSPAEGSRIVREASPSRSPGPGTPISLKSEDFEIYRSELITSTATAMLVDLSWSMALRGSFQAAKKVALALHNLITTKYPKDSFHIIGFAAYAKELKPRELPYLQWDEYVLGTNMQHALLLAEKLLARHPGGAKQIIMISDGEPTAHLEGGRAQFAYPPTPETIRATYRAVKHCTARGIAINTFMLDASYYLKAFMDEIARINGGRVFYTTPDKLGEYILVDYVQHKRKRLARSA